MEWFNKHLLEKQHTELYHKEIRKICKNKNVKMPDFIEISKRFKSTDGLYLIYFSGVTEIKLAYQHYVEFGYDSLLRVLRHELAHHICYNKWNSLGHNTKFKDLCLEFNACLNSNFAVDKYKSLLYDGIEIKDKWVYTCMNCYDGFFTKRKLNENRKCWICGGKLIKRKLNNE